MQEGAISDFLTEVEIVLAGLKGPSSSIPSIADIGDATPLEGDVKLPKRMGLQLLHVQEPSLKQDARNDVFPPVVPSTE